MYYLFLKRIVLSTLLLITTLEIIAQSPRFSFTSDTITLEVSKDSKNISFKVYKGEFTSTSQITNKKAIIGSFIQTETGVQFLPFLPFQKKTYYTVVFANEMYPFIINLNPLYDRLQVETLYPNSDTLPSNFLKWYIRFSKPVNSSKIYDHISLINNNDSTKVARAILPLETPLLSEDGTLLTLWIEPGRQKRDLGPNKRFGEVLIPNSSYTLIIDKKLKDREGIPMKMDFKHSFTVNAPDRTQPSITSWKFIVPSSQTKESIIIQYKELLDYGSLQNTLQIIDAFGNHVKGDFIINSNQKNIKFTPLNIWNKNTYTIKCKPIIEDLSGNNLERLFDQDITIKKTPSIVELSFIIQ